MAFSKILIVAALAAQVSAMPTYPAKIPNGDAVKGVAALGHVDPMGGGPRNKFGLAFAANEHKWTVELCKADSDGDGQTNGQELGDPCCQWAETGTAKVLWTTGVSAPGDATSKSDPKLWADVKCAAGTSNSTSAGSAASASKAPASSSMAPASSSAAPSASSKAPAATTAAPKSAAVSVSTGAAALALAATTAAALF